MLKALIKKQFDECFRSYFVNQKNGKANTRGKTIGLFVLFGVLMLFMAGFSFGLTYMMLTGMAESPVNMKWLVFTFLGTGSILFGVFGSVFNTYSSLYLPKDNESLLAMPIKPSTILCSRLVLVYLLSLLYSGLVWIPSVICTAVLGYNTVTGVVFGILLTFIIALLVMVITCALGWAIALVATRIKNKGIITMLLAMAFFGVYYYICFNLSDLMNQLIANLTGVGESFKKYGGLLYSLGQASAGDSVQMLLFTGVTLAMTLLCLWIMSKSYMSMLLRKPKTVRAKARMDRNKARGANEALLLRELKRFTASATYMMNAGFGIILLPILTVFAVLNAQALRENYIMAANALPEIAAALPAAVPALVAMIVGMNAISLPSVSLEGKNIWILQTLPVTGWQVLQAKRNLHILLNILPAVPVAVILNLLLEIPVAATLVGILLIAVSVWLDADLGLVLGLKHVKLNWTSEIVVIKQNMFVLVCMGVRMVILVLMMLGVVLAREIIPAVWMMALFTLLQLALTLIMEKWLKSKGAQMFDTL